MQNLDEIQCFTLLQNYARTEVKGTSFTYDISRLDEVRHFSGSCILLETSFLIQISSDSHTLL
jgi:hypothetical protein